MRKTFAIFLILAGIVLPVKPIADYQWAGSIGLTIFGSAFLIAAGLAFLDAHERIAQQNVALRINFRMLLWPAYHALVLVMVGAAFWLRFTGQVEAVAQADPPKYHFRAPKISGAAAGALGTMGAMID